MAQAPVIAKRACPRAAQNPCSSTRTRTRANKMQKFPHSDVIDLIKAGLESDAIKLMGSTGTPGTTDPASRAKADAMYLLTLFNELTE